MKNIISVFLFISFSVFGAGTNADSVLSLLQRGKLSEVAGDYNEAVDLYKQAIAQDSSHYEAHLYLGNLYHTTNELAKSLRQYNQAIKYGKDRAEAYFYRGNLQIDLGSVFILEKLLDYTSAYIASMPERLAQKDLAQKRREFREVSQRKTARIDHHALADPLRSEKWLSQSRISAAR